MKTFMIFCQILCHFMTKFKNLMSKKSVPRTSPADDVPSERYNLQLELQVTSYTSYNSS